MNILQKLVDAQLQLQSTQRNWDEECLFKCNDLLGEVIRELENAEQGLHPTYGTLPAPEVWTTPKDLPAPKVNLVPPISG